MNIIPQVLIGFAIVISLLNISLAIQNLNLEQINCKLDVNPITMEMLK